MAKGRSPLIIIFVTVFIDLVGFGIVIPVLPIYAQRFNASEATIGILLAAYSAMTFIFAPILGRISDRVGRRPVLLASIIGTSIGFLTMGLANTLWLLFLGRIIDGITGGNISTAQAYIADVTPPEKRSSAMGLIGAAFGLGFIFGPALGGILSHYSLAAPFYFSAALAAANAVAIYFLLPESLSHEHRSQAGRATIREIFQESGNWQLGGIFATYFFATTAFSLLTAIYVLFSSRRFGLDTTHNGYIFACQGVLGVLLQGVLLRRLIKPVGEKPLIIIGALCLTIGLFWAPVTQSVAQLLFASFFVAVGNSFMTPVLNGLASKSVDPSAQGRVLGALNSAASLARIIGPALGGWLLLHDANNNVAHYGKTPFWTGGVIMFIAFVLALTLHSSKASAPDTADTMVQTEG